MENASKALLIAGGVLIAMIIASFGVYLYGVYHEHAENVMNRLTESQITEFNAKFTAFEGRELTTNEVISIMNLVREENNSLAGENGHKVNILITGWTWTIGREVYNIPNIINQNQDEYEKICNTILINFIDMKYSMKISEYSQGLVNTILISKQ